MAEWQQSITESIFKARRAMIPFLPSRAQGDSRVVHLVNPLVNVFGGSENRTFELSRVIAKYRKTIVWSDQQADPRVSTRITYRSIVPPLDYPLGGNLVFVGVYFRLGDWVKFAKPRRVIAIYNTPETEDLRRFQDEMRRYGLGDRLEFVYASEWLKKQAGIPGEVHQSIIDLERFSPAIKPPKEQRFVVGRLSRDVREKHHLDDPKLWIDLAKRGFYVRLMGATCLQMELGAQDGIEILPVGAEPPEVFLRSLDAFVYRTDSTRFVEPSGRVVLEAMSCGLPVVCDRLGGYREDITEGKNGLFGNNNAELIAALESLRHDPAMAGQISFGARRYVEALFSSRELQRLIGFFIS